MPANPSKSIAPPFGGYIHWNDPNVPPTVDTKCQSCHAILDLDSKFTLSLDKPITARMELTKAGNGHILKITQIE